MPSDGAGNYSLPSGYLAVSGGTITTSQHNPIFQDVAAALTARVMANGATAMTGLLTLSGDPSTALQAATKQYVDNSITTATTGLKFKASVLVATTANITLSGAQTVDGVSLTGGERVLVKNQTDTTQNGLYVVGSGSWSRATDADAWTEIPSAIVAVERGTKWADTIWICLGDQGGTVGSTAMLWRRFDVNILRNAQTGTTYTVTFDDHGSHVTLSNASSIAVTLPQATSQFGNGFWFVAECIGAGLVTITPATSTINGGATLTIATGEAYKITSDGTNYRARPLGPAYAKTNSLTEDTAPDFTNDFVTTAKASGTASRKLRLNGVHSPSSGSKTASYTVTDSDRGTSIRFAGLAANATVTLPAASGRAGFLLYLSNEDTTDTVPFSMIVDPNGAELIDGFSTRAGFTGTRITILCDGTGWRTVQGFYRYFSGDQTITAAGSLTLAHGLGAVPKEIWCEIKCTTAEFNYSIGDIVAMPPFYYDSVNTHNASIVPDATNLNIRFTSPANTYLAPNKTTGALANLTNTSWRVRFYATA